MTDVAHGTVTFHDLRTIGGALLPEVTIAYTAKGARGGGVERSETEGAQGDRLPPPPCCAWSPSPAEGGGAAAVNPSASG